MNTMSLAPFGAQLRAYRMRRGMAQNELARAAKINVGTVNRLERDQRAPVSREQVLALATALDLAPVAKNALLTAAGLALEGQELLCRDEDVSLLLAVLGSPHLPQPTRELLSGLVKQASYLALQVMELNAEAAARAREEAGNNAES